ncbi:MAG: metallophosphoesterase, partial [Chlamydiia bacterium]|nr:metallophosphoesterase [Chlamydiia bacterium]
MVIHWHTPESEETNSCHLHLPSGEIRSFKASSCLVGDRKVYKLHVNGLMPDTLYPFQIGSDPAFHTFQTAPQILKEPLRFVIGGDIFVKEEPFKKMCKQAMNQNPLFAVLGGDIAYATKPDPFLNPAHFFSSIKNRWFAFLDQWRKAMTIPEGRLIPFLIVLGNHDFSQKCPELFFDLFAFSEKKLYRTIDFGNYLSLFLLDTNHFDSIEGEQTLWLEKALAKRKWKTTFQFPVY